MAFEGYTAFDWGVILLVGLSVLHAFMRGFTSVALSLAAWGGALLVTILGFGPISPYARDLVSPVELADILLVVALFIISLVVFKLIADSVGEAVKSSAIGFLDRSLGALFGLARGMIIVSVVFIGIKAIFGKEQPTWVEESKTRPLVAWGAEMVEGFAGSALGSNDKTAVEVLEESFTQTKDAATAAVEDVIAEKIAEEAAKYEDKARESLSKTIEQKLKEAKDKKDDP